MKKVLFVATVVKMHIMVFHIPYLELFKKNGYEVHVCAQNDYENSKDCVIPFCDRFYDLPFSRNPFSSKNIKVYKQLQDIIVNNKYDIIHCHTPVGGALTRLAAKKIRKEGTKVIYTAHGFHFFKGAPFINWIIYYPIEKWLSKFTDILVTITNEDYTRAKKFKMKNLEYVPGVGIDVNKFGCVKDNIRESKCLELGIPNDSIIILSVGELNKNKNHEMVIRSISRISNKNIYYIICGQGSNYDYLLQLASSCGVGEKVKLLGFRNDINDIYGIADIFAFPSSREGLSVALMEAMASSLPVVCTDIRGNRDLIVTAKGGFVVSALNEFSDAIVKLVENKDMRLYMGEYNKSKIKMYDINHVRSSMQRIYNFREIN